MHPIHTVGPDRLAEFPGRASGVKGQICDLEKCWRSLFSSSEYSRRWSQTNETKQNSPLSRSEQLIIAQVPQRPALFLLNPSHLHLPRLLRQDRLRLLCHLLESPQTLVLVIHLVMPCSVDIWGSLLFPEGKQEQWGEGRWEGVGVGRRGGSRGCSWNVLYERIKKGKESPPTAAAGLQSSMPSLESWS